MLVSFCSSMFCAAPPSSGGGVHDDLAALARPQEVVERLHVALDGLDADGGQLARTRCRAARGPAPWSPCSTRSRHTLEPIRPVPPVTR